MKITKIKQKEQIAAVVEKLLDGNELDKVAIDLGLSKMTVYSYARKNPLIEKAKLLGELRRNINESSDDDEKRSVLDMCRNLLKKFREEALADTDQPTAAA